MRVALVIPAYNEEQAIASTVKSVKSFADVIVVNDRSKDATATLAAEAGAHVVTPDINGGYDRALERGFQEALSLGYTHVITFDADGQHPSEFVPKYIDALKSCDLVVGVRPQAARAAEAIFGFYTLARYGLKDPLCGMKGYNLSIYKSVGHFDSYSSTGTELALRALKAKVRFVQIEIPIQDRVGESRFGSIFKGNKRILKSLWHTLQRGL